MELHAPSGRKGRPPVISVIVLVNFFPIWYFHENYSISGIIPKKAGKTYNRNRNGLG
jgi:hypothetical protein